MYRCFSNGTAFLLCISFLVFVTEGFIFSGPTRNICGTNEDADPYIKGDSENAVLNFLDVIENKQVFAVTGETTTQSDGCRKVSSQYRHRKGRLYGGVMWTLDCWDPFECKLVDEGELLKLYPPTKSISTPRKVRTVLLPLDEHQTASYTFLPNSTRDNIFFVTAALSGCSVFVAKPHEANCNLIAIHTNYRCGDPSTSTDYNHIQAMAVLEEVQSTNRGCTYQINRRWAIDYWRPAIERAGYEYANRVFYYTDQHGGFSYLYGDIRTSRERWQFCIKAARPNPPQATCYDI